MTIVYRILSTILARVPHCETIPRIGRKLDHLRCWGYDASAAAHGMRRNTHPRTGQRCVFYRAS